MHPFREGNGRSCKIFLSAYAANHGQMIDYPRKNEEMIQAQNEANIDQIAKLIKVENTPSRNRTLQLLASQQKNAQKQIRLPKTLDSKKSIAMIILTYSEVGNLLYALILGKAFYNLIISLKLLPNEKSPES